MVLVELDRARLPHWLPVYNLILKSNTLQLALQLMLNQLRSIFFHLINNGSSERTYVMELVCSDEPTENSAAL